MRIRVIFGFVAVLVIALGAVSAQKSLTLEELRRMNKPKPTRDANPEPGVGDSTSMTKKTSIVSEGSYSKVDKPFVYIVRDADTYADLGDMIGDFEPTEVDFTKNAVVAAFSGEKETGGYSVTINMIGGKCEIEDVSPAHGAIVTDALTRPYALALVPVEEEDALHISFSDTWKSEMNKYHVISGEFEFTGGLVGRTVKYDVEGAISTIRYGDFVTMVFDLHEKGEDGVRKMTEAGSGKMSEKLQTLRRVEGGSLIDKPHPPLMVKAEFEGSRVQLNFEPGKRGYIVSDGFEGRGSVLAVMGDPSAGSL